MSSNSFLPSPYKRPSDPTDTHLNPHKNHPSPPALAPKGETGRRGAGVPSPPCGCTPRRSAVQAAVPRARVRRRRREAPQTGPEAPWTEEGHQACVGAALGPGTKSVNDGVKRKESAIVQYDSNDDEWLGVRACFRCQFDTDRTGRNRAPLFANCHPCFSALPVRSSSLLRPAPFPPPDHRPHCLRDEHSTARAAPCLPKHNGVVAVRSEADHDHRGVRTKLVRRGSSPARSLLS